MWTNAPQLMPSAACGTNDLGKVKIAGPVDKHASNGYCSRSNEAEKKCGEISSMTAF
jgi:hypothetical protein